MERQEREWSEAPRRPNYNSDLVTKPQPYSSYRGQPYRIQEGMTGGGYYTHGTQEGWQRNEGPRQNKSIFPSWDFGIDSFLNSGVEACRHNQSNNLTKMRMGDKSITQGNGERSWIQTKPMIPVDKVQDNVRALKNRSKGSAQVALQTSVDAAASSAPGFVGIVALSDAIVTGKTGAWADSLTETFRVPPHGLAYRPPPERVVAEDYGYGGDERYEIHA